MICSMVSFPDWLANELTKRDISPSTLAKLSHKAPAVISRILNGERKPAPETIESIARALGLPIEEVFRAAGILPQVDTKQTAIERVGHKFEQLSERDQDEILALIDFKLQQAQNARRTKTGPLSGTK